MATAKLTQDATQTALNTASKLQRDLMTEQTGVLAELIKEIRALRNEFQEDKELIENFIAGMDSLVERMNTQIEAQIKLNTEERAFLERLETE